MVAAAAALAATAWVLGMLFQARPSEEAALESPIVAVLPLVNATGDPGNDHLGLGFADSLITRLAGIPSVAVVSRGAIGEYALAPAQRERIARDQGVSFLVDGSIQRVDGRLHVTIHLVDASRWMVRSSWEREGSLEGLFELQRRMAVDVSRGLMLTLSDAGQRRLESPLAASVLAYNDYSRARLSLQRPDRPEDLARGIALLEGAVARDPTFALAHAALGDAYWTQYRIGRAPEMADRALAAVERAARLDADDPEVGIALARILDGTGRRDEALALLSEVLERQPASDEGWRLLGILLEREGQLEEALAALERARAVRPGYWRNQFNLGLLYHRTGRFGDAVDAFTTVIALQEDNLWALENLGAALLAMGDLDGALETYRRAASLGLESEVMQSNKGLLHFWASDFELAATAYEEAIRIAPRRGQYHYFLARSYEGLGRTAEAEAALGQAIEISREELALNPEDSAALSLYALSEAHLGRLEDALQRAEAAVRLAPTSAGVLYRYAKVLALAGREEAALEALGEALGHGQGIDAVRRDPDWAGLRDHPGFRSLVSAGGPIGSP